MSETAPPIRSVLGVPVVALPWQDAIDLIRERIANRQFTLITWLNAHNANVAQTDAGFREALEHFLVLPDGIGVDIASKILHGASFPANLNGTDFTPAILKAETNPIRIGLIGAKPEVVAGAAAKFRQIAPQHDIRIVSDGFFTMAEEPGILASLKEFSPHILLVAMGVPRQELFMAQKLTPDHCVVAMGVGALFDFMAGAVPRAPALVQKLRFEWLYRLVQEPARLWRRYIVGNPLFLLRVMRAKLRGRN
ncbi:WecB/TagA/CpsF family glycosyltransferase [Phyllobacterium sp. YR531]|uniref:WecB/TagA/CpsF family glycosyltransferase n=1 Tax=Phyllobacterium sp. YR531 TaxID=1144343 RepID=UPI00026FA9A4|nr:WecB/TagA/CpsF family glycosyltransferase [Phyllobacterium sp. YR531]EJN05428.1 exopolysaccharide biosynthesis protein, WecB/TagA/CpsF family [Phyllobacterium sp. YR531]